jgi:hypothetical protein
MFADQRLVRRDQSCNRLTTRSCALHSIFFSAQTLLVLISEFRSFSVVYLLKVIEFKVDGPQSLELNKTGTEANWGEPTICRLLKQMTG